MAPKRKKPSPKVENPISSTNPRKKPSKAAVKDLAMVKFEPEKVADSEIDPIPDSEPRRISPRRRRPSVKVLENLISATNPRKRRPKAAVTDLAIVEFEPDTVAVALADSEIDSIADSEARRKAPKRKRSSAKVENPISSTKPRKRRSKAAVADLSLVIVEPEKATDSEIDSIARFIYEPIPDSEARRIWPDRYKPIVIKKQDVSKRRKKKKDDEDEDEIIRARCHYRCAIVDESHIYELNDDAYVHSGEEDPHICKIVEMFQGIDGKLYFAAQWFYRVHDTVIGTQEKVQISKKRVFLSNVINANELITLVKKLNILMITLKENNDEETIVSTTNWDYYCDMTYHLHYSTFEAVKPNAKTPFSEISTITTEIDLNRQVATISVDEEVSKATRSPRTEATLLDLYSGCGAMSTGLCMGAQQAGLNLVTKWAVDLNKYACRSMKHNHKETRVRNESAEDFLSLLKEWEKLCIHFSLRECPGSEKYVNLYGMTSDEDDEDRGEESDNKDVFTVKKIVGISFGNPEMKKARKSKKNKKKIEEIEKPGLYLKVRWLGYKKDDDTWEPIEGLSNCRERIKKFVKKGYKSSILPLPGGVDVVCGGPPCQGISGFNRFRNTKNPLEDERNKQLLVYMDIVQFLKPKYVLMENVVDILKFAECTLARYAVGKLVQMNYQNRMGLMAAGAYGLAQFRMRFFLWGAYSSEMLPQFPLPTHDLVLRGYVPKDFENNVVAYNEGHTVKLGEKLFLADVISDLPAVTNDERRAEMPYDKDPITDFQKFIRLGRDELSGSGSVTKSKKPILYDHHPLNLNIGDAKRVTYVPKKKNANFRDFPGVIAGPNNIALLDPDVPRIYLGDRDTPLVPDYALQFGHGTSQKPFGRLWWDETVSTVVTRAEPHNQVILHPEQDRVLTVRENARLQGFPDFYKLFGTTKQKYIQVGNAVAVPVARALGYALGLAFQGFGDGNNPLLVLPEGFPNLRHNLPSESSQ